jgi:hypothetical protein
VPSESSGGSLLISKNGQVQKIDFGMPDVAAYSYNFAAISSEFTVSSERLSNGCKIFLVYDIVLDGDDNTLTTPASAATSAKLEKVFREFDQAKRNSIVIPLSKLYSLSHSKSVRLMGADAQLLRLLRPFVVKDLIQIEFCTLEKRLEGHERYYTEDEYEEFYSRTVHLYVEPSSGTSTSLAAPVTFEVDSGNILNGASLKHLPYIETKIVPDPVYSTAELTRRTARISAFAITPSSRRCDIFDDIKNTQPLLDRVEYCLGLATPRSLSDLELLLPKLVQRYDFASKVLPDSQLVSKLLNSSIGTLLTSTPPSNRRMCAYFMFFM